MDENGEPRPEDLERLEQMREMADEEFLQETEVQVSFTTKLPEIYRVTTTPFVVSSKLSRYGLSEIINTLLNLERAIPFDFILNGELIRTSLEDFLIPNKLSAESILIVEYLFAILPPSPKESGLHDDWVGAVVGSLDRFVFTGSYDNLVRVWSSGDKCVRILRGHSDAVTSICLTPVAGSGKEKVALVSASKDRTLRLWENVAQPTISESPESRTPTKCFKGHTHSVQSVAVSPSGNQIASGSWDCSIKIWNVHSEAEPDDEVIKKRRLSDSSLRADNCEAQVAAKATLEGHTQCVSAVAYGDESFLYSVSWDHSVRGWNLETGDNTQTLNCSKTLLCLSVGGEGSALLATGGADHILRLWDPRVIAVTVPVLQLTSHRSWITSCRWHPTSSHHLISSSYDGTLKLWDVRAKMPLHTIEAHKDKALCVDWWRNDSIVSGGADSKLVVSKGVNIIGS